MAAGTAWVLFVANVANSPARYADPILRYARRLRASYFRALGGREDEPSPGRGEGKKEKVDDKNQGGGSLPRALLAVFLGRFFQ
jgi:hypothetical protein